jgi:hypothetical protein
MRNRKKYTVIKFSPQFDGIGCRYLAKSRNIIPHLETMGEKYDRQFKIVFDAIKQLLAEEKTPKRKIGF